MYNILICDDEADIRSALKIYLNTEDYNILEAENGKQALDIIEKENVHLLLMDIMMPVLDGIRTLTRLRENGNNIPVILLTAKSQDSDKVLGLNAGADDYITKPFSPTELLARVDSLNRRVEMLSGEKIITDHIELGEFALDLRRRKLFKNGVEIELTPVEFQLTEFLFSNAGNAVDRTDLLRRVWGESYIGEEKIVDVNIRRLRMKVEDDPSEPRHLMTVWGKGYKWIID